MSFWSQLLFALGRQPISTVEWRARALKAERERDELLAVIKLLGRE